MDSIEPEISESQDLVTLSERTQLIYSAVTNSIVASLIGSLILTVVLWPAVNHETMIVWLLIMVAVSFLRVLSAYYYKSSTKDKASALIWCRRFLVGSILASLIWASASIFLFPENDIARQVFLAFVVGGMAAGAITSLSYDRIAIYFYLASSLLPLQVRFYMSDSDFGFEMGVLLSLYFVILILAAKRTHANFIQNILLKYERKIIDRSLEDRERRYKTLLESAADAFYLHDIEGRFIDVNVQGCVALGYTREELLNLSVSDVEVGQPPDVLKEVWPKLERGEIIQLDGLHQRKDGTVFSVEVRLGLIHLDNQVLFTIFARDVTRRKEAEQAIINAKNEAEAANKAKTEFLSHMSHELRTPMTAILGFSQIMDSSNEMPEKFRKYSNEITKAGKHLIELINGILDLSSIEAGKLNYSLEDCRLNDILDESLKFLEGQAEKFNIKLINEISAQTDYIIYADHFRFKQVLLNLISNAIKYNKKNGTVTISCDLVEGNYLRVEVKDTGKGLSEEEQTLLFKPFERIGEYKGIDGAGIGLVITRSLIEMMGGEIGVKSKPGEGSIFWVKIALKII